MTITGHYIMLNQNLDNILCVQADCVCMLPDPDFSQVMNGNLRKASAALYRKKDETEE